MLVFFQTNKVTCIFYYIIILKIWSSLTLRNWKKIGRKKDVGESAHKNSNSGMQIMSIMTAKITSVRTLHVHFVSNGTIFPQICNGNRTEWSPIRSVIIRVITKSDDRAAGVRFVFTSMITKSYYQLIRKITISEKKKNSQVMKKGGNSH